MSIPPPDCGLDVALAVMGGKWKPLVLFHLQSGPKRFGDLKRLVTGISEKVLIQQLRELVAAEVLTRHDYQEVPPKVDYTLTPFGKTLLEALMPLCEWGIRHRAIVEATPMSQASIAEAMRSARRD
jgi:DNA-binding HxlR family transcriptional regulator